MVVLVVMVMVVLVVLVVMVLLLVVNRLSQSTKSHTPGPSSSCNPWWFRRDDLGAGRRSQTRSH